MSSSHSSRKEIFRFVTIVAILLASCAGDTEEEATIQAAAEAILSTETPTPTNTATAAPTDTPFPPTDTATPAPTDTPFPPTDTATLAPTDTPFPPTDSPVPPTSTPAPGASWTDPLGDTIYCDTGEPAIDPEVDIVGINASRSTTALTFTIQMSQTLQADYSFAVALFNFTADAASGYLWEIHEGNYRIGDMDPTTFQLLANPAAPALIDYDVAHGVVQFSIPVTGTLMANSFIAARSFHTAQVGEQKTCDVTESLTLPADLFLQN